MGDPWVFRGQTPYEVTTQPTCWIYSDRRDVVAELYTTAHDRYPPFPTGLDRLFFPVYETVTVDWHNTTTGQRGQVVGHGDRGQTVVGIPGGDGVIEMDIRLRSDHPLMHAVGSTPTVRIRGRHGARRHRSARQVLPLTPGEGPRRG